MLEKLKDLNKEYAPVLVSVAALYVSYNSYLISENQLSVSKVSVEPHFYVGETALVDNKTNSVYARELKVFNIGAPVTNISTSVKSFYEINDYDKIGKRWIPLNGYYYGSFRTGDPKGLIVTHKGHKNAIKDFNVTFIQYRDQNEDYINIELKNVVFVSYVSFDGSTERDCFLNTKKVECDDVEMYREPDISEYVELENLTYKKLIEKYNKSIQ